MWGGCRRPGRQFGLRSLCGFWTLVPLAPPGRCGGPGSPTAGGLSAGQPVILGSPTSPGLFRRWGMHGACLLAVGTELCEFTCGSGGCAPGGGSPPPSLPGGGVLWALCPAGPGGCHVVRTGHSGLLPIWRDSPLPTHTSCGFWPRTQTPCPGGWWTQARPAPPATSSPRAPGGGPCTRAPNPSGRSRQPPSHSASTVAAEADAKPSSVAETQALLERWRVSTGPHGVTEAGSPESMAHRGSASPEMVAALGTWKEASSVLDAAVWLPEGWGRVLLPTES